MKIDKIKKKGKEEIVTTVVRRNEWKETKIKILWNELIVYYFFLSELDWRN